MRLGYLCKSKKLHQGKSWNQPDELHNRTSHSGSAPPTPAVNGLTENISPMNMIGGNNAGPLCSYN